MNINSRAQNNKSLNKNKKQREMPSTKFMNADKKLSQNFNQSEERNYGEDN
jgi:hypothetical protein